MRTAFGASEDSKHVLARGRRTGLFCFDLLPISINSACSKTAEQLGFCRTRMKSINRRPLFFGFQEARFLIPEISYKNYKAYRNMRVALQVRLDRQAGTWEDMTRSLSRKCSQQGTCILQQINNYVKFLPVILLCCFGCSPKASGSHPSRKCI